MVGDRILLASGNPHKADEIRAILGACAAKTGAAAPAIVTPDEVSLEAAEPTEDGDTFYANAAIKAAHYARAGGMTALADDSGLAVDALDGAPGVVSARYAGAQGDRAARDRANNRKLLANLEGVPAERRAARFVCVMVLAGPDGEPIATGRGTVEGRIILAQEAADPERPEEGRGSGGFGYDPLFQLPDGRTTAELSGDEKNAVSHRGRAIRALWARWR